MTILTTTPTIVATRPSVSHADAAIRDWVACNINSITIRYTENGAAYVWTGTHWATTPPRKAEHAMQQMVRQLCDSVVYYRTDKKGVTTTEQIAMASGTIRSMVPIIINMLTSEVMEEEINESHWTAFRNCTVRWSDTLKGLEVVAGHAQKHYCTRYHDVDLDHSQIASELAGSIAKDQDAPTFARYWDQLTYSTDAMAALEKKKILADAMGCAIMGHARKKCAIQIVGPRDCGKSTVIQLLQNVVPDDQQVVMTPAEINDSEARTRLHNKSLWAATEISSQSINPEAWKTITSHETINGRALYRGSSNVLFRGVIAFAGNESLRFPSNEDAEALYDRIIRVPIEKDPSIVLDDSLMEKLRKEKAGIIHYALSVWVANMQRGWNPKMTILHSVEKEKSMAENSVIEWLTQHYEAYPGHEMQIMTLHKEYMDQTGDRKKSLRAFSKDLQASCEVVKVTKGINRLKVCLVGWAPVDPKALDEDALEVIASL